MQLEVITARNGSCRKVMFSQEPVYKRGWGIGGG